MVGWFRCLARLIACTLLLSSASHVAAQALSNDIRVTAEITQNGQIDGYFFDANGGDVIYLTAADRDGTSLNPVLQLYAPDGTQLANVADLYTAEVNERLLTMTGRYTVLVLDSGADDTGIYTLNYVRVPGANEMGQLENDARIANTLALGDIDTFTFTAVAGQRIHLNVADVNGSSFNPHLRLHDPSGAVAVSIGDLYTASIRDFEITSTGVWTVVVSDSGSDDAGDYALFFASAPGANEKGLLLNDSSHSHALALGDVDTWTFTAGPGDKLFLNVSDTLSSNFNPELFVYDPSGNQFFNAADLYTAQMYGLNAVIGGLYTVVVKDSGADDAGIYDLYFARAPYARELGLLMSGEAYPGSIDLGDIDTFEFAASVGSTVLLNIGEVTSGSFNPYVSVYDENGDLVAWDSDLSSASLSFPIPNNGFYSVIVEDSGADDSGDYVLNYVYIGPAPPLPTRSVVLEPYVWHQLGIPGSITQSYGALFGTVFDLDSYGSEQAVQPWIVYAYETDPASSATGVYRVPELSEPLPLGTGFWVKHLSDTAVRLNLPPGVNNAIGAPGDGCAPNHNCVSTPLAQSNGDGGWTMAAVPSLYSPTIDLVRFMTDAAAPDCSDGCTLSEAYDAGYSSDKVWHYDPFIGDYVGLAAAQSIQPWQGFWAVTTPSAAIASPRFLLPVQ